MVATYMYPLPYNNRPGRVFIPPENCERTRRALSVSRQCTITLRCYLTPASQADHSFSPISPTPNGFFFFQQTRIPGATRRWPQPSLKRRRRHKCSSVPFRTYPHSFIQLLTCPERVSTRPPASLHEILTTPMVFALLKYGKGKERERAAFNNLGNGTLPQHRETSAGPSTLSGQNTPSRSFGRASGRKIKTPIPGITSSGNIPSTSHLPPRPHTAQPSPSRSTRTSADTVTYDPLPLFTFSLDAVTNLVQDDIGSTIGRARNSE